MATRTVVKETEAQAMARLAAVAAERGIAVWSFQLDEDVAFFASSATSPDGYHAVDVDRCDCQGFARVGRCTHVAALRLELGLIAPAPATHMDRSEAMAIAQNDALRFHPGAALDAADGDYPTDAEYRALIKLAVKRGVKIVGLRTTRPYAIDPTRGRFDLSIETCSCPLGIDGVMCQHLALFVDQLADAAELATIAA